MQKMKRILALLGIILLVGLYLVTFIASLLNTSFAHNLFMACFYATIMLPIMLYAYVLIYKVIKKKKEEE